MTVTNQTKNITYNRQSDNEESDVGDESLTSRERNSVLHKMKQGTPGNSSSRAALTGKNGKREELLSIFKPMLNINEMESTIGGHKLSDQSMIELQSKQHNNEDFEKMSYMSRGSVRSKASTTQPKYGKFKSYLYIHYRN